MSIELIPTYMPAEAPSGEKNFFDLASKETGFEKWCLFWDTNIDIHDNKNDGQCDFIFLGPEGLFVIEVKGGDYYESKNGLHRWGWLHSNQALNEKNESPLSQAKGNMYSIKNYLSRKLGEKIQIRNVFFAYGAAHPQADLSNLKGDIEFDPVQIFYKKKSSVRDYLKEIESHFKNNKYDKDDFKKLSDTEINLIKRHLQSNYQSITSKKRTEDSAGEILRLEGEQKLLFEGVDYTDSRILVQGAAGTGKTILAKYVSENHSLHDQKTLWISFNRLFTESIKRHFSSNGYVEVYTHIEFLQLHADERRSILNSNFNELIEHFLNSTSLIDFERFDAVVIDEAQDILTIDYLLAIDQILIGGLEKGNWAIFLDDSIQASVFNILEEDALKELKSHSNNTRSLLKNRRNTKKTVSEYSEYLGINEPECLVSIPGEVTIKDISEPIIEKTYLSLEQGLRDLITANKLNVNDLVVLTPTASEKFFKEVFSNQEFSQLGETRNRFYLKDLSVAKHDKIELSNSIDYKEIKFCNIHAFKGLEKPNIILIWQKKDYEEKQKRTAHLYYTALSRATNDVYILLIDDNNISTIKN